MERLSEYMDEELDRSDRQTLEAHLLGCPECAALLADLKRVRARACELKDAPVPAGLWPRIEAAIAEGRRRPFPVWAAPRRASESDSRRGARFSFSLPELVAACLGIAILSGGSVYALLQHRESPSPPPATSVARAPESPTAREIASNPAPSAEREAVPPAVTAVLAARSGEEAMTAQGTPESPHEEAITELRKALAKERHRLDPATVRALEANLTIIDLAIDQARRALAADPANTYVKEHLAETMRRKVELLQRATLLASTSGSEGSR
jgi:anti-sigma factor RsiW